MPVQISHLKAAGRPNWGKVARRARADRRRARGRARRPRRRVSVHRVQHVAAHAAAGLGARGRRRRDARPAHATPAGARSIREALTTTRGREHGAARGLGQHHDRRHHRAAATREGKPPQRGRAAARKLEPVDALFELLTRRARAAVSVILFQMDEARPPPRARAPRGDGRLRRLVAGADGPTGGEQAAPAELRHVPARARRVRARAAHDLAAAGRAQDDGPARAAAGPARPRRDSRGRARRPRRLRRATGGGRGDLRRRRTAIRVGIEHVLVNGRFVIKDGEHTGQPPGPGAAPPLRTIGARVFPDLLRPLSTAASLEAGLDRTLRRIVRLTGAAGGVLVFRPPRREPIVVTAGVGCRVRCATGSPPPSAPARAAAPAVPGTRVLRVPLGTPPHPVGELVLVAGRRRTPRLPPRLPARARRRARAARREPAPRRRAERALRHEPAHHRAAGPRLGARSHQPLGHVAHRLHRVRDRAPRRRARRPRARRPRTASRPPSGARSSCRWARGSSAAARRAGSRSSSTTSAAIRAPRGATWTSARASARCCACR